MKIGIVSDIHGNLPAFLEILRYLREKKVASVWCLGDAVGYGPWPAECLKLAAACGFFINGNHEELVAGRQDLSIYSQDAKLSAEWTKKQLTKLQIRLLKKWGPVKYLVCRSDHFVRSSPRYPLVRLVHASPLDLDQEYLVPGKITADRLVEIFAANSVPVTFYGHTHMPSYVDSTGTQVLLQAGEPQVFNPFDGVKRMFNPGSVGQPRDGDPRASAGILTIHGNPQSRDSRWVFNVVRRSYDIGSVVARYHLLGLPDRNGTRLYTGR